METLFIIALVGIIVMACFIFFMGKKNSEKVSSMEATISDQVKKITELTSERDVQAANAENLKQQFEVQRQHYEDLRQQDADRFEKAIAEKDETCATLLTQQKEASEKQFKTLQEMSQKQLEEQEKLITEKMQTISEKVLKQRGDELGAQNTEQVTKIVGPLQNSLKEMKEALDRTKGQQQEALTRLDESIRSNLNKSASIGEAAERLANALTGEVKAQGNFGELRLKQLLEDMELKEGEQYDTQEMLKDRYGKAAKGDDGKGLIPDFILHFPGNRHVVVDSKMSLTDFERYMNAEEGSIEKSTYLKAHITSVRNQVKRLAKKEYTKYLPDEYNKLNFAIMYVPIDAALNLAILNDTTLWKEAYDDGVMILGPQTMYMNLRVLEMMWTQVRQLENQQVMVKAANNIVDRVQDLGIRFKCVEDDIKTLNKHLAEFKITTAQHGLSIIVAAQQFVKLGSATENKKKKSLEEIKSSILAVEDSTQMLESDDSVEEK